MQWRRSPSLPEPLRLSIQTAVAVSAAYLIARVLQLPEPSWAVFSALFVLQASVGGTITNVIHRIIGGVVGLLIGLACLYILGTGGWRTVLGLVISVGSMTLISARWPSLGYGLVTVAILVVAPGYDLVEDALVKAVLISIGSVCGALAAITVFPATAHRRASHHLGRAIERCGELLAASMRGSQSELPSIHAAIERELNSARGMLSQSRQRDRVGVAAIPNLALLPQVDRLWYTLALADRLSGRKLGKPEDKHLRACLESASEANCRYLRELGKAVKKGELPPFRYDAQKEIEALVQRIDDLRQRDLSRAVSRSDVESLFTLSFTWQQIGTNIEDIEKAVLKDIVTDQPSSSSNPAT